MQSHKPVSAESTADQALIKELISTSDYKFLLPAAQNKLTSISNLSLWFITITKMLARFDAEAFLFGTTASLNNVADLKLRTIKLEDKGVKLERVAPTSMDVASKVLEELRLFGAVTSFAQYERFLEATSYKKLITASQDLQHLVAPSLFLPKFNSQSILSKTQQFKSPEYQETVTIGNDHGLTLVSDQREFVFPSEQRMTSVRAVTFHYVRGDRRPESRIHQLLRPLFWRWLTAALTGTDFAHLLTMGWECDHTWIFGRLIKQQEAEREETDQLFAILAVQDDLRTKAPSKNLMTWYVEALKKVDDLNAITRTYREGCGLMILPTELVDSLYKVHAHREGFSEVMSRVARDNKGYVPILELQKAIANLAVDKNRQKRYSEFDSMTNSKAKPIPNQVNSTGKSQSSEMHCCYKFLEGRCHDANCKHPHLKVAVPAGVCSDYLTDRKSCTGSCGKLHERWGNIIRKANEGKLNISPAKGRTSKKVKDNAATSSTSSQPTDEQESESDSDSDSGGKGTRGIQASAKSASYLCTRCGKTGHEFARCYSSTHFDGSWLKSPKPCPVPEEFRTIDQTWEARKGENQKAEINSFRARFVRADQYMEPDSSEPDSLVIVTEGSKICL